LRFFDSFAPSGHNTIRQQRQSYFYSLEINLILLENRNNTMKNKIYFILGLLLVASFAFGKNKVTDIGFEI
jgi:hypothetical protein